MVPQNDMDVIIAVFTTSNTQKKKKTSPVKFTKCDLRYSGK